MRDTGHLTLVPEYVEPAKRLPDNVYRGARWICFLILLASLVLSLPARGPGTSDYARLLDDIGHGRTSTVQIENLTSDHNTGGSAKVRWQTGPFSWHQATVEYVPGELSAPGASGAPATAYEQVWKRTGDVAAASGHSLTRREYRGHGVSGVASNLDFSTTGLWEPLAVIGGFLWLATFLGMLFTREHPFANRWAWFWLFVLGGLGPLLILWKEPEPLRLRFWRRDGEPHRWDRTPMTGGIGLLNGIGWTILLTLAASGVGWLASR